MKSTHKSYTSYNKLIMCEGTHKERGNKGKVVQLSYHNNETGRPQVMGYEIQITTRNNKIIGGGFFPTQEKAITEFKKYFNVIEK